VTVIPIPPDEITKLVGWLCHELERLPLDDVRYTMMNGKRPPAAQQQRYDKSCEDPHPQHCMGHTRIQPEIMTEPFGLGFIYQVPRGSLAIRMAPEHFDRADRRQDALFKKCIAIMEILRDGPIKPKRRDIDWLNIGSFHFRRNKSEEEATPWNLLVEAWNSAT
jgi:hypothetical protein